MFHACRVFRATTGTTIQGFRRELGVAEALAELGSGAAEPAPDRDLSAAIADALRARYAEATTLGELVSVARSGDYLRLGCA